MVLYAVLAFVAFAAVLIVGSLVARASRVDEVAKFHRARALTTEWSRTATVERPSVDVD